MDVYCTVCGSQADGCEHDHETCGLLNWADTGLAKRALRSEGISQIQLFFKKSAQTAKAKDN